jgi:photosystem II stability/assembly factor-like uncharacterized protein
MSTTQTSTQTIEGCSLALDPLTLSAWRDGALDADEMRRVGAHVAGCDACQALLAQYDAIGGTLRAVRVPEPIGGYGQVPALPARRGPVLGLFSLGRWGGRGSGTSPHLPTPLTQLPRPVSTLGALAAVLVVTLAFVQVLAHLGAHPPRPATTPSANVTSASTATPIPTAIPTPTDVPAPTDTPTPPPLLTTSNLVYVVTGRQGLGNDDHSYADLTTDGGATWTNITPPRMDPVGKSSAYFLDASTGWIAFIPNENPPSATTDLPLTVAHTVDGGQGWAYADLGTVPFRLGGTLGLQFLDDRQGRLWVSYEDSGGFTMRIYGTTDGGGSWQELTTLPSIGRLHFVTASDGWAVVAHTHQEIIPTDLYLTHDGGTTWQPQPVPGMPTPPLSQQAAIGLPTFFTGQDGVLPVAIIQSTTEVLSIYHTHDGGVTWGDPAQFSYDMSSTSFFAFTLDPAVVGQEGWITIPYSGADRLVQTHDAGQTWNEVQTNNLLFSVPGTPIVLIDAQTAWYVQETTPGGWIYRTTDGGVNWAQSTWQP